MERGILNNSEQEKIEAIAKDVYEKFLFNEQKNATNIAALMGAIKIALYQQILIQTKNDSFMKRLFEEDIRLNDKTINKLLGILY